MTACVVVVVNYNSGMLLRRNLESIRAYGPGSPVIVVDNASSDGSQRVATLSEPGFRLVVNASNVGFAKAVNQAMSLCDEPYVLLLNPDARLQRGALERLTAELDRHPECGVAGPRILDEDGGVQGSVRGDPNLLTGLFGRSSLLTRMLPGSRLSKRNVPRHLSDTSTEVEWVSGACMLCRRTALDVVGGFDERYFLYWEDADLCRRLRSRGITIRHVPASEVVHAGGQSSRTAQSLAIRAFHSSAYTYYATHVARTAFGRNVAWIALEARCRLKLLSSAVLGPWCLVP